MAATHFSGPVRNAAVETDGTIWIPASAASLYTGTWTNTRVAAGDYCMRKGTADQAGQAAFHIGASLLGKVGTDPDTTPGMASRTRGFLVNSIDLIYQVTAAALDAHTYDITACTFANNVANAVVTTPGGTLSGTLATATQANPYVTRITLGTPYVVGANTAATNMVLEVSWDTAATSVLSYYGIFVNVSYNLR